MKGKINYTYVLLNCGTWLENHAGDNVLKKLKDRVAWIH